jgi:hypothetical protein
MGLAIERESFSAGEFARFNERLTQSMAVLRAMLARPGTGREAALQALVEWYLDGSARNVPVHRWTR